MEEDFNRAVYSSIKEKTMSGAHVRERAQKIHGIHLTRRLFKIQHK